MKRMMITMAIAAILVGCGGSSDKAQDAGGQQTDTAQQQSTCGGEVCRDYEVCGDPMLYNEWCVRNVGADAGRPERCRLECVVTCEALGGCENTNTTCRDVNDRGERACVRK